MAADIRLDAAGAITGVDGADDTADITGGNLIVEAATQFGQGNTLDFDLTTSDITSAGPVTFDVVGGGGHSTSIDVATGAILIDGRNESDGGSFEDITLTNVDTDNGTVTVYNSNNNIIATLLDNSATDQDVRLETVNAGNISVESITANAAADVLLFSAGAVEGIGGLTHVVANRVDINAETGIGSAVAVNLSGVSSITADTTNGNVDINNAATSAVTMGSLTTGTGTITYDQTGNQWLYLTNVAAADGSININNTGGANADIEVGVITADTINDVVTIDSTGAIDDFDANPDIVTDITAYAIDLNAVEGIGNAKHIDLAGSSIDADTTGGNLDINNAATTSVTVNSLTTGTGTVQFDQTGPQALVITNATTTDGGITITNSGANLTAGTINAGGTNNISLSTIGAAGDVIVGTSVTATGDQVDIVAVDNVTLTGTIGTAVANLTAGAAINGGGVLTAGIVDLGAGTGIGNTVPLNIASATIDADATDGNIRINNNQTTTAVTVNSLTTGSGTVQFDQTGGQTLGVTNAATTDGAIAISNTGANLTVGTVTSGGDTGSNDDVTLETLGGAAM